MERWPRLGSAVGVHFFEELFAAAGPADENFVDGGCGAEAEVETAVVLRQIAGAGDAFFCPALAAGKNFNPGADAVAIAFAADELEFDPVAGVD